MAEMNSLAKQTAIYGVSSILGRFLNWCLAPMYTYVLTNQAEYGIYTNIYAWVALLLVLLTYGMETGLFRFMNAKSHDVDTTDDEYPRRVYSSILWCVAFTSVLFSCAVVFGSSHISSALGYGSHADFVSIMGVIVAIDAFCCIPMAYLRQQNRSVKFAVVNLVLIFVNIFFNVFFLVVCPWLYKSWPDLMFFYNPEYGVGYVFVANLFSTLAKLLMLVPEIRTARFGVDMDLLKRILRYSLPLLVLGVAGIMNQTLDKILFPYLYCDGGHTVEDAHVQLGIYGACFKVAMVMMMFTQAFRYAYEPFIFAQNKNGDEKKKAADATKFFIIFSLLIFLGIVFYLDILKLIIKDSYWEGLQIVPVVLISYLFQGVYFNLSMWYKLSDKTYFGAILSVIGLLVTVSLNVMFVSTFSYWASACASLACFFTVMILSYVLGQKYYPVPYDLKSIFLYFFVAMSLYALSVASPAAGWLKYLQNTIFMFAYMALIFKRDLPLRAVPFVGRFFR